MLATIPFKRHTTESKVAKKVPAKAHVPQTHVAAQKSSKSPGIIRSRWAIIGIVLVVAIIGIVVIRLSRASGSEPTNIPTNLSSIQSYVNSLGTKASGSPGNTVSGYVEYSYTPQVSGVATVAYYVDGTLTHTSQQAPYSFVFDTSRLADGEHIIEVVGFNSSGVPVVALSRQIMVNTPTRVLDDVLRTDTYPF